MATLFVISFIVTYVHCMRLQSFLDVIYITMTLSPAALLGYNPNMRYHPRIQMAALKVGFHALLLHKYSKRLQTYSHLSQILLLKMLDGKFFNSLLFNRLSKINGRTIRFLKRGDFC